MKSSKRINSDIIVAAGGAAIIATFSVLLYLDFSRKIQASGVKKIGTITFKREVAQRKYNDQVVWEKVEQHAPVYNFDSIRTSDMSQAYIRLEDGTEINVDENSLILLSMAGDAVNINFAKGSISANKEGGDKAAAGKINIKSSDATITMSDGELRMAKTEGKELDLTVNDGKAEVVTGKDRRTVLKDEKLILEAGKAVRVVKLALRAKSPSQNAFFVTTGREQTVNFSWEPVKDNPDVTVEISRDIGFEKIAGRTATKGTTVSMALPEGAYYWRLKARSGGEAVTGEIRTINILRDEPIAALSPAYGDRIAFSSRVPIIRFRWQKNRLASAYTLEIARDSAFRNIVKNVTTPLTEIALDGVPEGNYFWRVRTSVQAGAAAYSGSSQVVAFSVKREEEIRPPSLMEPADGVKMNISMLEKKRLFFSWNADPSVTAYEIQIAADSEFRNPLVRRPVTGNLFAADMAFKEGTYFWRVGSRIPGASSPMFSQSRVITVTGAEKVVLNAPRVVANRAGQGGVTLSTVEFSWGKSESGAKYLFELSSDRDHTSAYRRAVSDSPAVRLKDVGPGVYYWRVKLLDKNKSQIAESDTSNFNLTDRGVSATMDEILKAEKEALAMKDREEKTAERDNKGEGGGDAVDDGDGKAEDGKDALSQEELKKEELRQEELRKEEIRRQEIARREELKRQEELKKQDEKKDQKKDDISKEDKKAGKAALTIVSNIKGSEIFVDSQLAGTDRVTVPVDAGKVTVEARLKGYYPFKQELNIRAGEKRTVAARLMGLPKGGKVRWTARLASAPVYSPSVKGNMMYVSTKKGEVACIGPNGAQRWKVNLGSRVESAPAAGGNAVYVSTVNGTLFSLNAATGRINWKFQCAGPLLFGARPAFENGTVYAATSYGYVYALSEDGKALWQSSVDEGVYGSMIFASGVLILGTDRSRVYGLDPKNGNIKWKVTTDGRIFKTSPKVFDGTLYIGTYAGTLYAIKAKSGSQKWRFKTGRPIYSTPRHYKNMVFLASSGGMVYALNASSGSKVWEFDVGGEVLTDPDLVGESFYVASKRALFAFNVETGEVQWKENLRAGVNTSVVVSGREVVVGLQNGEVTAFSTTPY